MPPRAANAASWRIFERMPDFAVQGRVGRASDTAARPARPPTAAWAKKDRHRLARCRCNDTDNGTEATRRSPVIGTQLPIIRAYAFSCPAFAPAFPPPVAYRVSASAARVGPARGDHGGAGTAPGRDRLRCDRLRQDHAIAQDRAGAAPWQVQPQTPP